MRLHINIHVYTLIHVFQMITWIVLFLAVCFAALVFKGFNKFSNIQDGSNKSSSVSMVPSYKQMKHVFLYAFGAVVQQGK